MAPASIRTPQGPILAYGYFGLPFLWSCADRILIAFHDSLFFFLSKEGIASKTRVAPSVTSLGNSFLRQKNESPFSEKMKQNALSEWPSISLPRNVCWVFFPFRDWRRGTSWTPSVRDQTALHDPNESFRSLGQANFTNSLFKFDRASSTDCGIGHPWYG